jgi:hypothetical protein
MFRLLGGFGYSPSLIRVCASTKHVFARLQGGNPKELSVVAEYRKKNEELVIPGYSLGPDSRSQ